MKNVELRARLDDLLARLDKTKLDAKTLLRVVELLTDELNVVRQELIRRDHERSQRHTKKKP